MRGACARMRGLTRGRGCSEASTRKRTEALSDFRFFVALSRPSQPTTDTFFSVCGPLRRLYRPNSTSAELFFNPKPAPLVVSRTALCEWGFNSVLPSFRVVVCCVDVCGRRAYSPPPHTHTPNQNYTIPSTSVDISQPCQKSLPLKPLEIEPSPSRRARFVGYASSKMTATGGKRKQTPTQRPPTAAYRPDSERFPRQM